MTHNLLNNADHARVAAAIASAEAATSGEIYCVMTRRCYHHWAAPLLWGGLAALLAAPIWLASGLPGHDMISTRAAGWESAHGVAAATPDAPLLWALALLPLLAFVCGAALIALLGPLRPRLVPRIWRQRAVHRAALNQFLASGIQHTAHRTGVLIFLSVEDHMAEIVADKAIYAKVAPTEWADAVTALVDAARHGRYADGFVTAIERAGAHLAQHFPPRADNPNELPDRLVEIG